jgi:hypothetical protein
MNINNIKLKIKKLKNFLKKHPKHLKSRKQLKKLQEKIKSRGPATTTKPVNLKLAVVNRSGSYRKNNFTVTYKVVSDLVAYLGGNKKAGQKQVSFDLSLFNYQDVLLATDKVYWNGVHDVNTTVIQWQGNNTIFVKIHYPTDVNIKVGNTYYAQAQMSTFLDGSYTYSAANSTLLPVKIL